MLFNSVEFISLFLPIVIIGFYIIGITGYRNVSILWLIAASLFFYGWWNPVYLLLIIISVLFNYTIGSILVRFDSTKTLILLIIGISVNIITLCYFKYANFFVANLNNFTGNNFNLKNIILPLAISFFTFQQIAYLVDSHRKKTTKHNLLHYFLFVTFFPQLIAGPIVYHKEMLLQFKKKHFNKLNLTNLGTGLTIFSIGLFKKVVMADGLSTYVSPVFSAAELGTTITFFEGWVSTLAYTFQLYFDFSGYSDMAIGLGKMLNINLPINFHSPYKSTNIIDFWKRWHITLSRFLRDYLYIPLGGNKKGSFRRYINLIITMLLGGLWHGANWTFVIWGGMHGFYIIVNRLWQYIQKSLGGNTNKTTMLGRGLSRTITFIVVALAWVLFRSDSIASSVNILGGMIGLHGFVLPAQIDTIIPGIAQFVETVQVMPLLGGGLILGIVEVIGLIGLSFVLICFPATHEMSTRLRIIAIILIMYFTIQAVFFSRVASEFLYFQF